MSQELNGKRVLVTGGTRGIGRATVLAFAEQGAQVVTCCHTPGAAADNLARELAAIGGKHQVVIADVTEEASAAELAQRCREALGGLDVLVNNVGVDGSVPLERLIETEWHRVLDHNVTSAYLVTRQVLPLLADGSSVISIGSAAALRGRPASAHYSASKAALVGFTRGLCKELGPRGIRVNSVAPGFIEDTPGEAGAPSHVVERIVAMTPLARLGTPADVTGAVLFLAGDTSTFVSGVTLNLDGGM